MNDKGYNVVAYNRTTSKVDDFLANEAKGVMISLHVDNPSLNLISAMLILEKKLFGDDGDPASL